jgi:hypothetical protein
LQTAKVRLKKVCLKKNDLSWNLSGGAHTQGQTELHKEIPLCGSIRRCRVSMRAKAQPI